jgi:hypothetical protein
LYGSPDQRRGWAAEEKWCFGVKIIRSQLLRQPPSASFRSLPGNASQIQRGTQRHVNFLDIDGHLEMCRKTRHRQGSMQGIGLLAIRLDFGLSDRNRIADRIPFWMVLQAPFGGRGTPATYWAHPIPLYLNSEILMWRKIGCNKNFRKRVNKTELGRIVLNLIFYFGSITKIKGVDITFF